MKHITIILLAFISFLAGAQVPYNEEKNIIEYTEVVEVPGINKEQLFKRAYAAVSEMYEVVDKKITEKDAEKGTIVIKGFSRIYLFDKKTKKEVAQNNLLYHKFTIMIKDGKYKYSFNDFYFNINNSKFKLEEYKKPSNTTDLASERAEEKLQSCDKDIQSKIEILKKVMSSEEKKEADTDW